VICENVAAVAMD